MTTDRGEGAPLSAGGPVRHIPVLLAEAIAALRLKAGGVYLDGTFGAGGYTRAILAHEGTRVIALDRDPRAIAGGFDLVRAAQGRLTLVEARFGRLDAQARALGHDALDGVALDIGVSSMQFDEGERGFSFRFDGPLDMRMSGEGRSAADIVNGADEEEIADILFHYGEERAARRIARAIVHDRRIAPFRTTQALAAMIARVVPGKPRDIHPATRAFQGLRIAVNEELRELVDGLAAAERILKPGGRLVVVSFHSLEDRIVKQFLAARSGRGAARSRLLPGEIAPEAPSFESDPRQPVSPSDAEIAANPRARSARLRAATRTQAPAHAADAALARLAALPDRSPGRR
ncbi:MAG: 16S rRNA (cytosine(1402)-N(4))-methyltransferase RsmH [Methylobacteriaceae bacterium]|nr:16S rRNA (cytosine(1402)-N(4))-methyltransferase RsmH [Methylobacteriaceae bacterium]